MKKFMMFGLMMAVVACSSKDGAPAPAPTPTDTPRVDDPAAPNNPAPPGEESKVPVPDGGTTDPVATPDSGPKAPTNQAECIAVCEAKYPTPAKLNHTLDANCMLGGSCEPDCNNLVAGKNFEPEVDPDAVWTCDTKTANSYPISTPSQDCSNCLATTKTCCDLWIAIFGSDEGKSLNACANTCFSSFKN